MKSVKFETYSEEAPATSEVHVRPKEQVAIELDGGGTTGYIWEIAHGAPGLDVIEHRVEPNLESFGGSGIDRFVVQAQTKGRHDLVLKLRAPWEDRVAKEFKVTINSE